MEFEKLFDIGFSAVLLFLFIRQEARMVKLEEFIQAVLTAELQSNERDRQAARDRKKLGRAMGIDLTEDTESNRPPGLDDRLHLLNK